ncbi:MAG: hypothetical protein ABII01_01890 [Candidatus Woesearchaeota archaeon]
MFNNMREVMQIKRLFLLLSASILIFLLIVSIGCTTDPDKIYSCQSDSDCVPTNECHPMKCINKEYRTKITFPRTCTEIFVCSAAYNPEDCLCINNKCINKNLDRSGCEREDDSNGFIDIDSPFGAHGGADESGYSYKELYSELADLGINIKRVAGRETIIWDKTDPDLDGNYDYDFFRELDYSKTNNIDLMVTLKSMNKKDQASCRTACKSNCVGIDCNCNSNPCDWEKYENFLSDAINKHKSDIKYWQIENEVSGSYYSGSAQDYAELLKRSYKIVKANCPDCRVIIAGMPDYQPKSASYYSDVLEALKNDPDCIRGCFDIFDLHTPIRGNSDRLEQAYGNTINLLSVYGFNKPVWSTEFGPLSYQGSEIDAELVKFYVIGFEVGFEKLFWRITECPACIFENGKKTDNYYALKTVIDKLYGFDSVSNLDESQYKFIFSGKNPVYVLWCISGTCPIPGEISGTVVVTNHLGDKETKNTNHIKLNNSPIFVEEI